MAIPLIDPYANRLAVPKPHGVIVITGEHGEIQADTLQCCHCGNHWIPVKGSGIRRGWCHRCGKVTCGAPGCDACVPYEQRCGG